MLRRLLSLPWLVALVACGTGTSGDGGDGELGECGPYPAAPPTMALDEPLPAFSWPVALDAARNQYTLDLEEVRCDADEDIDWSPFDVLLFVSIPAW